MVLTVYPKKYAHGFCFAVLCCGYTLTDFPISIRLTSLVLWQSNDCPSASKATLMNMDKYFMWIHYERLYNHNKAKHNKTVCIFLGIYCKVFIVNYRRIICYRLVVTSAEKLYSCFAHNHHTSGGVMAWTINLGTRRVWCFYQIPFRTNCWRTSKTISTSLVIWRAMGQYSGR